MRDPIEEFSDRLIRDLLPTYCHDPERRYSPSGYKPASNNVAPLDAADFLRALDNDVVTDRGGGRYYMPQSKACEVLFWEGSREKDPRPITLWIEPVITIASVARLHLDYRWPKQCLGMQSADWAFDLTVVLPDNDDVYIAGEVKKSDVELQTLVRDLNELCACDGALDDHSAISVNSRKKWQSLKRYRAPLFWAVGPGGVSHVFEVAYSASGLVSLHKAAHDRLVCPVAA